MRYGFTTIKVADMEASLKFYQGILQLKEIAKFNAGPDTTIVFLKDDFDNKIELIGHRNEPDNHENIGGSQVSVGFLVDSLDETLKLLKENDIEILRGPVHTPDGVKFVYVKDPNGAEIEFIEGFRF